MAGFSALCAQSRSEWLPRHATAMPQFVPNCCSTIAFHDWIRGELMPGSIVPKVPNGTYGVLALVTMGCGSLPWYGSSNGTDVSSERFPNGGALASMLWYSPDMKSYATAYDERTASRPCPRTSQAMPPRRARAHHCLFIPAFALPGNLSLP